MTALVRSSGAPGSILHGGFALGLGLIGVFWLDALIATIRGAGPMRARWLRMLTLIGW